MIVVITEVGDLGLITAKATGKEVSQFTCLAAVSGRWERIADERRSIRQISKRELTVADRSEFSCRLSLWNKTAETFNVPNESVVAFKVGFALFCSGIRS